MKLEINVGQIFLTHPRDENFTSVYEESFSKQGGAIYLFAVIEIAGLRAAGLPSGKDQYQKLARTIVGALKRTYIAAPLADEDTFEKALSNVNSVLARTTAKEQISVLPRLNVAMGAVSGGMLSLSTTGNAIVYLMRGSESTLLSEGLASEKLKPTKLFCNYSSGRLAARDRVIMANRELLNFLSVERLNELLAAVTLEDVCEDIIESLTGVQDTGFAAYVFEVSSGDKKASAAGRLFPSLRQTQNYPSPAGSWQKFLGASGAAAAAILRFLGESLGSLVKFVINFFRVRPKKYLFAAIFFVLVLLLGNLAYTSWRKNHQSAEQTLTGIADSIDQKLAEAESALIYNNQNRSLALVPEIAALLLELSADADRRADFETRLVTLKNQVNRELRIENPTVLTAFESVPTDLIRSPNGFLAFNNNSGRLAFYDFRTGAVRKILQNQNTGNLGSGLYLGPANGYVFLDKDGHFLKLGLDSETLTPLESAAAENLTPSDLGRGRGLAILGVDANARLYILDAKNQQIWKLNVNETAIAAPETWLKTAADFTDSLTLAVDSSIYVLYPRGVEKYAGGTRQNFQIAAVNPPPQNLAGMFTLPETSSIYLLDPANERVIILNKQGQLEKQITSPKFRDLTDIYVDEKSGLLYALAGSELLQINYK